MTPEQRKHLESLVDKACLEGGRGYNNDDVYDAIPDYVNSLLAAKDAEIAGLQGRLTSIADISQRAYNLWFVSRTQNDWYKVKEIATDGRLFT